MEEWEWETTMKWKQINYLHCIAILPFICQKAEDRFYRVEREKQWPLPIDNKNDHLHKVAWLWPRTESFVAVMPCAVVIRDAFTCLFTSDSSSAASLRMDRAKSLWPTGECGELFSTACCLGDWVSISRGIRTPLLLSVQQFRQWFIYLQCAISPTDTTAAVAGGRWRRGYILGCVIYPLINVYFRCTE